MTPSERLLAQSLRRPSAPRVLTNALIARLLPDIPTRTQARAIKACAACGGLVEVRAGRWLNGWTTPPVAPEEAVPWLFPGGVVSLQRALGQLGIANNPSHLITVVVPHGPQMPSTPSGRVETPIGVFQVHRLRMRVVLAGTTADRLLAPPSRRPVPGAVFYATGEKALVDWVALAHTPRSGLTLPSVTDIDITGLDAKRVRRLAQAAGLAERVQEWWARAEEAQAQDWEERDDRPAF